MMGERTVAQEALFYSFSLERHVPADNMLRSPVPPKRVAEDCPPDAGDAAARGDPLDSARYGQGGRACRFDSAVDLEGAWPCAASLAKLQAIQRSGFRREASRYRRPLCFATCTCGGAVLRREVPDSGA